MLLVHGSVCGFSGDAQQHEKGSESWACVKAEEGSSGAWQAAVRAHSSLPPQAVGICPGLGARGAHMLLQNELFLNVGTKDFPDGELRGHVAALPYSGHSARHDSECSRGLPPPLVSSDSSM